MPVSILIFLIIIILILTICSIIVSSIQIQWTNTKNKIGGIINKKIYGGETMQDFLLAIQQEINSLSDIDTAQLKTIIDERFQLVKRRLDEEIEDKNNKIAVEVVVVC